MSNLITVAPNKSFHPHPINSIHDNQEEIHDELDELEDAILEFHTVEREQEKEMIRYLHLLDQHEAHIITCVLKRQLFEEKLG